jgi:hypothetical protein
MQITAFYQRLIIQLLFNLYLQIKNSKNVRTNKARPTKNPC